MLRKTKSKPYFVYLLRCQDKSIYTGIAVDLEKRLAMHQSGKGARYTRSRGAVKLIYSKKFRNKSLALKREWQIKQLSHQDKIALSLQR